MAKQIPDITEKLQELVILDSESRKELYKERIKIFPNVMEERFDYNKEWWLSKYEIIENSLKNDILFGLEDEIRQKNMKVFLLWELKEQISAETLANEVRERKPDNLLALTNLAFIYLYNENISKLKEVLDHLSKLQKRDDFPKIEAEGKMNVAYLLGRLSFNDYERAIKLYKEASDVCPHNYSCLFSIALLRFRCLRNIYDKEKLNNNIKEAEQCLEKIRCNFPRHVDKVLMGRTLTLLGLFKHSPLRWFHSQPCKVYFQRALNISPNDRYVLEKCATYYKNSHQLEKSQKLLEKAIEINETSFSHYHLATIYLKKNNPKCSYSIKIKDFSNKENVHGYIVKYPQNIPHIERNELIDKAEYHFKQALKISPSNSAALYDLILLYMSLKEYENARKYCERFKTDIKIRDVSFNILFGRLYYILADEENDDEVKEELRDDGTDMFFLAVNAAIELLPFQKKLKDIWRIKDIMTDVYKYGNIEYNTLLLELIQSVELPDDEDLYNKLLLECDKSELSRKIKKLCKNKQYLKAYYCLRFSQVKPNEVDVKLKKEIYVNLAKHISKMETKNGKVFFRKCYDLCYGFATEINIEMMSEHLKDDIIIDFLYDIYILTSPNSEQLAESIGTNLEKYFGLKATFGNHDYILGKYKTVNLRSILKNSCNIGIILENSKIISQEFLYQTKHVEQIMNERQPQAGQLFIINNHEDMQIPKHLERFPQLKCKSGQKEDILNIFNFLCSLH